MTTLIFPRKMSALMNGKMSAVIFRAKMSVVI